MESINITHTSFEETCRVCLAKNGALVDIFRCQNRNIPEEIHYCSGIVINMSDNLPPNICIVCLKQLSVACNFKQKCLKADEVFRQVLVVEQVEYLEDYFQVTEQEHSSIYVADIDKENTKISRSKDKILSNKDELQDIQKVYSQNKRIYACDKCPSKYYRINYYWRHMRVKHGEQSKEKKRTNVKIEFEVINSTEHSSNQFIKEINSEDKTEEITNTVDCVNSDYLTDNEYSDPSLRDDENSKTNETTEQNSISNILQKETNTEYGEFGDDKNLNINEIKEQISTLTIPKEARIVLQDVLVKDDKTLKTKEITEQNSILRTEQERKKLEIQVKNLEGGIKMNKTKDISSLSTTKINKKEEITEQISTLNTVQNRTGIEQDIKKLESRLKIDKIRDVVSKVTPRVYKCTKCDKRVDNIKAYHRHRNEFHKKPVPCFEKCNKQLRNPDCYRVQYTCDYCKRVFPYKYNLSSHISVIHLKKVEKKYSCQKISNKEITEQSSTLNTVTATEKKEQNTENKPYKCTRKISNKEITEQTSTLNTLTATEKKEQNTENNPYKCTQKISNKEITEQTSTLNTVTATEKKEQNTENNPYKCTQKISNEKITEQTSTLNTVQKRAKNAIISVENLEGRLKMYKKRNLPSNIKLKAHKCLKCDISFGDRSEYEKHERTLHKKLITCEICGEQYSSSTMKIHIRTHTRLQYLCNFCGYETKISTNFRKHMKNHSDLRISKYICDYCKKEFPSKPGVCHHILALHLRKTTCRCTICNLYFDTLEKLRKHQWEVHNQKHVCEICGKQFSHYSSYFRHKRTHGSSQYACDMCGYATVRKSDLAKHMNIHSEKNKFTCEHCNRKFCFKSNLLSHTRRIHLKNQVKNIKCNVCDKLFVWRSQLDKHYRGHLGKSYSCEYCPSTFTRYYGYKKHLKNQHGVVLPLLKPGRKRSNGVET